MRDVSGRFKQSRQPQYHVLSRAIQRADDMPRAVSPRDWDEIIDVNIKGVLNGIAAVLPFMEAQRNGHIINTA